MDPATDAIDASGGAFTLDERRGMRQDGVGIDGIGQRQRLTRLDLRCGEPRILIPRGISVTMGTILAETGEGKTQRVETMNIESVVASADRRRPADGGR